MIRIGAALAAIIVAFTATAEARTWRIAPGPQANTQIQEALLTAAPGDQVRLAAGTYAMTAGLSLDIDRVTVRGAGQDRTILSFTGQTQGAEGLLVTSDGVVLQDFAVENSRGDAIKARDCNQISMIGVRAEWTRGPNPENGAYGLYPVNCDNVLIEKSIARGASDAGIYVGQSRNIIVRDSIAENNVAGFEIENSYNADVYGNIARNNTGGILVFDLPGLPQQGGRDVRVFNNDIRGNNTANFAPPGNIVASVPAGTGVLIMANKNVHIFNNRIGEHGTANVIVTAYRNRVEDANYNALPRDIMIRDNKLGRSGYAPGGDLAGLTQAGVQLPDVLWDGATMYTAAGTPHTEVVRVAMQGNSGEDDGDPTFLSLGVSVAGGPFSEMAPNTTVSSARIAEPPAVRLPQD